jgi:hypothetical protein
MTASACPSSEAEAEPLKADSCRRQGHKRRVGDRAAPGIVHVVALRLPPSADLWLNRAVLSISGTQLTLSGGDRAPDAGRAVWRNGAAIWQELAGVVEEDDAVAQQAPPLLGVEGDGAGRVTVRAVSWRARGLV